MNIQTFKCRPVDSKKNFFMFFFFSLMLILIGMMMIHSLFSSYSDMFIEKSDALHFTNFMPFVHLLMVAWVAGACIFIALYTSVGTFLKFNSTPIESSYHLTEEGIEISAGALVTSIAYRDVKSIEKIKSRSKIIKLNLKEGGEPIFLNYPTEKEHFLKQLQDGINNAT